MFWRRALRQQFASNLALDLDAAERRSDARQAAVLRVALITIGQITQFCRVVNVSPRGVEVRLFSAVTRGTRVRLQLPDTMRVSGTVVKHGRGEKVIVFKYKRRKQYKKTHGHRQDFTAVLIDSIGGKSGDS